MGTVFFVVMFLLALTLAKSLGIVQLLIAMLVWMFVGNIAGQIIRGEDYGVIGNIALGLAGGFVGTHLFNLLGIHIGFPIIGYIITGVVGAIVFIYMMRLVDKNFAR